MANEKRLIDAKAILKKWRFDNEMVCVVDVIDIKEAPTVDAVEVVRCKDCKHWEQNCICRFWMMHDVKGDNFCSYGERRTDNG